VWTKGTGALDGEFQSASEVDFYIDKVSIFNIYQFSCLFLYCMFFIRSQKYNSLQAVSSGKC